MKVRIFWKEDRDTRDNFRVLKNVSNVSIDNEYNWIDIALKNKDIQNTDYGDYKVEKDTVDGSSIGVRIEKDDENFDHIEVSDEELKIYTKVQVKNKEKLEIQRKSDAVYHGR